MTNFSQDRSTSQGSNDMRKQPSNSKTPTTFTKLGDWSTMTASRWHDAMYFEGGYFMQLWADTLDYTVGKTNQYCGSISQCVNVEVGSGTGDVILGMASSFRYSIGLDINADFLQYSRERLDSDLKNKVKFVQGSATELSEIMQREVPDLKSSQIVVTCVNNTIGIFPDAIKPKTYQQMQELAGIKGIIIIGFWNANKFGDALQHFYAKNPQLCGSMEGASIDWENHTLITAGGYRTHWSTPEEAKIVLFRYGFDVIDVTEIGAGVLCTCKGRPIGTSPAPLLVQRSRGTSLDFSPHRSEASKLDLSPLRRAIEPHVFSLYENAFQQVYYREAWGGRNQHIGLYVHESLAEMSPDKRIVRAGELATERLFRMIHVKQGMKIADFGSGFGDTARFLAQTYDASVTCIDLSTHANKVNRNLTAALGLEHLVHIGPERSFFETGEPDSSFDVVISQDTLCHAEEAAYVAVEEATRILKPGGFLLCSNILVDPQTKSDELSRVLARLKLSAMDSPDSTLAAAESLGLECIDFEDTSSSLVKHFETILEVLDMKYDLMISKTSEKFLSEIINGLENWRDAGKHGSLRWAFFAFRKASDQT